MGHQRVYDDWTGNVVADATVRSLDPEAVRAARASYLRGHPDAEPSEDDQVFLTQAGLLKRGRVTNAAMILLGKATENVLPQTVSIRWRLVDVDGFQVDSRVFRGPAILTVRQAASMVRNSTVTVGEGQSARHVSSYRFASIMEAIFNAVLHQDFTYGGTVDVIEREYESVTVVSRGGFPDVSPEDFALSNPQLPEARNPFLKKCMEGLKLVSGNGSGIRGMYLSQLYNHFPPPEFTILDDSVSVTFRGIRSGNYCRMLDLREDVDLETALDLYRVDRGLYVPPKKAAVLERRRLVKSENGMLFLRSGPGPSPVVPHGTDREVVVSMVSSAGSVSRAEVADMLRSRDPKGLTDRQLSVKATNLLQSMCRSGVLERTEGSTKSARYGLKKDF